RRLTRYEARMREFFAIGLRVEPLGTPDVLEAMRIQREAALLTNDALLLATARRLNCEAVASADRVIARLRRFRARRHSVGDLTL
ncbi:MAG: PIN domain-containing protein, partial [Candidatus Aminicenantes bacterium]|nr:PIN domain-containing protein [Candidatus Aminicenantes bacterium]